MRHQPLTAFQEGQVCELAVVVSRVSVFAQVFCDGFPFAIEPGKKADVIIVDLNDPRMTLPSLSVPSLLVNFAKSGDVATTIVDGKILMRDKEILVLDEISISEPKTKEMAQVKTNLAGDSSALFIVPERNETIDQIHKAANNLPDLKLLNANYMNIRDLLGYEKVIIPLAALDVIESYLG